MSSSLVNATDCSFTFLVSCMENVFVPLPGRHVSSYAIKGSPSASCSMILFSPHSTTDFSTQAHIIEIQIEGKS